MNEGSGSPVKWIFLLLGCGGVLGLVACGGCFASIFFGVFGIIKSSEPYTRSLNAVQGSPEVQAALGTPIEPGFMVSGNLETSGAAGKADIQYSVSGPKGSAQVNVVGEKSGGAWDYSVLRVQLPDGSKVDLLGEAPEQ